MTSDRAHDSPENIRRKRQIAGWMLDLLGEAVNSNPFIGAEIGVKQGNTASFLLDACPSLEMILVDRWRAFGERDEYRKCGDPAGNASQEQYDAWLLEAARKVRPFGDRVRIIIANSLYAAELMENGRLSFVFLDADHTFHSRLADLQAWVRTVAGNGMIFGGLWHSSFGGDSGREAVEYYLSQNPQWNVDIQQGPCMTWAFRKPEAMR